MPDVPPDLGAALRAVEPAARLVPERQVRKVLRYLRDHGRAVPSNPGLPLWVSRADLVAADATPTALAGDEPRILLLTAPDDRLIDARPPADQRRAYWRLLVRAAAAAAVDAKLGRGTLNPGRCAERLARLGAAADREVRFVLESDHAVDPAADDAAYYRAFAAAYLDLLHFTPAGVAEYYPSLPAPAAVLAVLGKDFDPAALVARARPAGAADPDEPARADTRTELLATVAAADREGSTAADAAIRNGNFVRAAILHTRAAGPGSGGARAAVGELVAALAGVLHWDGPTQAEWREALGPLLGAAACGSWPRAARCLYELQKIPADLSAGVFAVDLVESARSLGRRPVKRPLPHARGVMLLSRVRAATAQMRRSRLDAPAQAELERLFSREAHHLEGGIRGTLTPLVTAALDESGFCPANRVEAVARAKVVAELLDRACERGFIRLGDLRDAVARNQLKMPDLAGPGELLRGDPLLRADTRLADALDGVYRRGEVYLRALQRASSVFFGTRTGRFLSLYLIAPFLAAFLTLMTVEEFRHLGGKVAAFASKILAPPPPAPAPVPGDGPAAPGPGDVVLDVDPFTGEMVWFDPHEAGTLAKEVITSTAAAPHHGGHHGSFLTAWPTVAGLGVVMLLLFHAPPFRRAVVALLRAAGRAARVVLWDVPQRAWRSEVVRAVRYSPAVRFVHRHLGGAVVLTAGVLVVLSALGASPLRLLTWGGIAFAVAGLVFNTPWGRAVQERLAEDLSDGWRVLRVNLLPGLLAAILDTFTRLANWVERRLYAVDEWLRYRGGGSRGSLVTKAVFGLLWFPVAYLARFAFYLLIEPQINPVKHFPVVTVSHKVILPMTPRVAAALGIADAEAALLLGCIPGVFGFVAWELMANWQLYRANRPPRLRPATIGSHGETMRGLLRPGFHSGAVPGAFRKLRTADRSGHHRAAGRARHDLDHAAEAVHRFAERELVGLLGGCAEWGGGHVRVRPVRLGCQRVAVEVVAPERGGDGFVLAFENVGGRIGAAVEQVGWVNTLSPADRDTFLAAARGLLDLGAAELFDGQERTATPCESPGAAKPYAALGRTYSWDEWVARWEPPAGA